MRTIRYTLTNGQSFYGDLREDELPEFEDFEDLIRSFDHEEWIIIEGHREGDSHGSEAQLITLYLDAIATIELLPESKSAAPAS